MDEFQLEIHNWNRVQGTVRIRQEHSGVKRVIMHIYEHHTEIIEHGDKGEVYATHFLGLRPEDCEDKCCPHPSLGSSEGELESLAHQVLDVVPEPNPPCGPVCKHAGCMEHRRVQHLRQRAQQIVNEESE